MLNTLIKPFIVENQLPDSYMDVVEKWFLPLTEKLVLHQKEAKTPFVIGINGAQGSGKTTLAELLVYLFEKHYQLKAIGMSIDDFYYTQSERQHLAKTIHPLLKTRGVPGTHDIDLALSTLTQLLERNPVAIPRFNKAIDDRVQSEDWPVVSQQLDVIVIEGWCLGAEPQAHDQLLEPINLLEEFEDPLHIWRSYINQQLIHQYPRLSDLIDQWVMLKAPSFDCVYHWRLEQETKLKAKQLGEQSHVMSSDEVKRFVKFYQRITEHLLVTLPNKVDYLFELDEQRKIIGYSEQKNDKGSEVGGSQLLIYSDMDGSLLNHDTYDFSDAKPLLERLEKKHIPVIPCTSKTASELIELRIELNNHSPFIVENGAAVYIPVGTFSTQPTGTVKHGKFWVKSFTKPRTHWLNVLNIVKPRFANYFRHFSQMPIEEISAHTGLDIKEAINASRREYGEPVLWLGDNVMKKQFIKQLKQNGAEVLEGGRFLHVSGLSNKGLAMGWLTEVYQRYSPSHSEPITLAIGDSNNDIAMLEAADIALLIRSSSHDLPAVERQDNTYVSEHIAPLGWKQGVEEILQNINNLSEITDG